MAQDMVENFLSLREGTKKRKILNKNKNNQKNCLRDEIFVRWT